MSFITKKTKQSKTIAKTFCINSKYINYCVLYILTIFLIKIEKNKYIKNINI